MPSRDTLDRTARSLAAARRPAVAGWHAVRGRARGSARRVGAFVDRVPLRVRLVVAMLVTVAVAQVVTGAVALEALDRYLTARLDGQLTSSARTTAAQLRHGVPPGGGDLARFNLPGAVYLRVDDGNGDSVFDLPPPGGQVPAVPADPTTVAFDAPRTVPGTGGGGSWRLVVEPVPASNATLVMAVSLSEQSAIVTGLALIDFVVGAVVLVLLGGVGFLLVRASLRPLRQVETVAAAIADGQLDQRVPQRDPRTEVGRLTEALNAMLARIEGAFRDREASEAQARASEARMRRFVADASHELRTPLTSIRGFAELYRQGAAADTADVSRYMRRIEAESSRMGLLVEDLLLLARLDQQRPLQRRPVDLAVLAADAVHDARVIATDRRIELRTSGACVVNGDEPRLRQVLGNLVTNALTHTAPGVPVAVTVARDGETGVLLEVADRGPGLAPEHAARVFERFYRADPSRARHTGGSGLGLAIVAAIVAAHDGTVEVRTAPGSGATFRVHLRAASAAIPKTGATHQCRVGHPAHEAQPARASEPTAVRPPR
ncbi:sensor histidine kinase [Planosporangium mesophilum]|uniref:sensor histidine kinase n=1 Tax=Planosporangium mesophilum TaxID=689768 RepID=UPI003570DD36